VSDTSDNNSKVWDEILDDVNYDFLPIEYVSTIIVRFLDGKTWEVAVDNRKRLTQDPGTVIHEFLEEYKDSIDTVDFRLDTERLKKDITRRTKRFLKLNK
tara:strand:+ start:122 stop:421 length:300 start_codon:yes stop_codon:yes gene_type:complete